MVAVRATHPAKTFGCEKEKPEGASEVEEELLLAEELADGDLCFTKCRRSSRATWGGILLAI